MSRTCVAVLVSSALVACGGSTTSLPGSAGGAAGTAGSSAAGGDAGSGAVGGAGGSGGASSEAGVAGGAGDAGAAGAAGVAGGTSCETLSHAIAKETSGVKTCSTVVRLDYESLSIVAFQIVCGSYGNATEAQARQTAQTDTGFGEGSLLSGPNPQDVFVFYESPGDFGGVAVVNARNGLSVFGGGIVWMGNGEVSYPSTWRSAASLGPDCIPMVNALPPPSRGFDLRDGSTLDADEVEAPLDEAWVTALPDGLLSVGYVFDAAVLLYPRTVGDFDPSTAEWVVSIQSGWLE